MANYGGEAANYHNPNKMHSIPLSPQQQQGGDNYNDNPPSGGQYAPPPYPPSPAKHDGPPPSYDELFPIEKPKWNDLWAGLLFLATCAAFVVVSAISIQGYGLSSSITSHTCVFR